jgi:hypothetical protein
MMDAPTGWAQVAFRALTTAVIAFVVLQAKEFYDAGRFDTTGTGADALLIGAGVFLVNAVLKWSK